jgi:hypothetical protein
MARTQAAQNFYKRKPKAAQQARATAEKRMKLREARDGRSGDASSPSAASAAE